LYINLEDHELFKSNYSTLVLQLVLGSDHRRELFNLKRLEANKGKTKDWNILFCKKYDKESKKWYSEEPRVDLDNYIYKFIKGIKCL
jgi:hypothetical protein